MWNTKFYVLIFMFIMHPPFHQVCFKLVTPEKMEDKKEHPTGQQFPIKSPPKYAVFLRHLQKSLPGMYL